MHWECWYTRLCVTYQFDVTHSVIAIYFKINNSIEQFINIIALDRSVDRNICACDTQVLPVDPPINSNTRHIELFQKLQRPTPPPPSPRKYVRYKWLNLFFLLLFTFRLAVMLFSRAKSSKKLLSLLNVDDLLICVFIYDILRLQSICKTITDVRFVSKPRANRFFYSRCIEMSTFWDEKQIN